MASININGVFKNKFDFNKNKLKLLKPKINESNGAKTNFHLNLKNLNINNNNMEFIKKDKNVNVLEELLKNQKIKFPRRNKSNGLLKDKNSELDSTTNNTNYTYNNTENFINHKNNSENEYNENNQQKEIINTKVSNFHKLKDILNKKSNLNTICLTRSSYLNTYENELTENCDHFTNTPGIHFRNSKSNKKLNNLTTFNINETLPINLKKLNHLRTKSLCNKKEGIEIIDDIIKGLTKLKTIIANEDEENQTINVENNKIEKNKNNLLISSTSGNLIKENKKIFSLMNSKTSSRNSIKYEDETLNENNFTNENLNESLIMRIQTEEPCKSFIVDRYNNTESIKSLHTEENNFNKNLNSNNNFYLKKIKNDLNPNKEHFHNKNKNKFKIDKFEYKILNKSNISYTTGVNNLNSTKNKNKLTLFPFRKKDSPVVIGINSEKINNIKKIFKRSMQIDNDDFTNYEFVD